MEDHAATRPCRCVAAAAVPRIALRAQARPESADSADITLQLRSRFSGRRIPRIYPISDSRSPSGSSVVEIYPDEDGEYEIRPSSLQGSRVSTRLRIHRDITESRRRVATRSRLAPGAYVARHLRSSSGGAGWSLQASYSRALFKGFGRPFGAGAEVTPKSHRLSFGVGWYQ